MSRTLFEEAIADAKQLREAAEQNAKNAIIEAVTPRIREFIENQLVGDAPPAEGDFLRSALSEADEEEAQDDDGEVALDETALKSLVNLMSGKTAAPDTDKAALAEAFSSLSDEEQAHLLSLLREGDVKEASDEEADDGALEVDLKELKASIESEFKSSKAPHGVKVMKKTPQMEEELYELDEMMFEEDEDEMSDDALAEAVLKLVGSAEEREAFDKLGLSGIDFEEEMGEEGDVEVGDEEPSEEEPDMSAGEEEEEGAAAEPVVSENVYEIDENMLRHELARLREAKARKSKKAKGASAKSHKVAAAAFGGGTLESDALDVDMNKLMKEARENRELKKQLNDYRGAVETLREQLSDLNLFNAKLLYVNKILQNKDVAPTQRRSIIEALDGASNLREAKLLYQSLTTSISSKNESLNESVKHTAGLASRPVTSSSARMSGAGEVDRWAILAGLK
jgi:hypothetical protein